MKVSDAMSTTVDYVSPNTKVKDVCRLIFGRGINGLPVCKGKKIIGHISERDILSKFYPSMQEYMEDPYHESNFEEMESKVEEIFSLTADKIMSKSVTTITPDTPLLKAQSTMFVNKVGRLPVVDKKGNLIGIITKGDIFRATVGDRLPLTAEEEYHDWQAKHYDIITDWSKRLSNEIPDLSTLFKKNKIKNVIDIGYGTGEHAVALSKEGFSVLGIESSRLMHEAALEKTKKLPENINQRLNFAHGNYVKILSKENEKYGAAIFMGNAFAHLVPDYRNILTSISKNLLPKNSVVVLQVTNFEKIFKIKNRVLDVNFWVSRHGFPVEHAFLRFYDPPKERGGYLTLNTAIFDFDGKRWKFRTMNSTPIVNLDKENIKKILIKNGFKKVLFYGGEFFGPLFKNSFNSSESDWLNVVALR